MNEEDQLKPAYTKPALYRPRLLRVQKKAIDLQSEEMFPSLANADKVAKELEEKKKVEEEQRRKYDFLLMVNGEGVSNRKVSF